MQFVVTAMDFEDDDALKRRMEHREAHITGVKKMIAEGNFLSGGAILNDDGQMIGSTLHLEFPDAESLGQHLQEDPYVDGRVWQHIDIKAVKLVPLT